MMTQMALIVFQFNGEVVFISFVEGTELTWD